MDSEFIIAFKEVLREELTKKNSVYIEGLGHFEVIHREQYHKRYDTGKVLLMPPTDLLQFKANIKKPS
jgi:nucleoid DNA-binding protein